MSNPVLAVGGGQPVRSPVFDGCAAPVDNGTQSAGPGGMTYVPWWTPPVIVAVDICPDTKADGDPCGAKKTLSGFCVGHTNGRRSRGELPDASVQR